VWVDSVGVYTNHQVGGVMRGVGVPQICFAGESQLDMIAREIGLDPYEIRSRNALEEGDTAHNGQKLIGIGYRQTLERAVQESGIGVRRPRRTVARNRLDDVHLWRCRQT